MVAFSAETQAARAASRQGSAGFSDAVNRARAERWVVLSDQASASVVRSCGRNAVWIGEADILLRLPAAADVLFVGDTIAKEAMRRYCFEHGCDVWLLPLPVGFDTFAQLAAQRLGCSPATNLEAAGELLRELEGNAQPHSWRGPRLLKEAAQPQSLLEAVQRWAADGPLVRLATGFDALDNQTNGGPAAGSLVTVVGAPDAGKSMLLAQLADRWDTEGHAVGFVALDEHFLDLAERFLQRRHVERVACQRRGADDLEAAVNAASTCSIAFYGHSDDIAAAAEQVARRAAALDRVGVLCVDSIHALAAIGRGNGDRFDTVSTIVEQLRELAQRLRILVVATAEMNRAGYRTQVSAAEQNGMAAGADSRLIEFASRLLLSARSVPGSGDLLELRVEKSKFGPRTATGERGLVLRMDRAAQVLHEVSADSLPPCVEDHADARKEQQLIEDAAALALAMAEQPGAGWKKVEATLMRQRHCGAQRCRMALSLLDDAGAVVKRKGERTEQLHWLIGAAVPKNVLDALPADRVGAVRAAEDPSKSAAAEQPSFEFVLAARSALAKSKKSKGGKP